MRKRIIGAAIFAVIATLFFNSGKVYATQTGTGTLADPYIISDGDGEGCARLGEMGNAPSAYYKLGSDIDCSDSVNWNNGYGFYPVGLFANDCTVFDGVLDGQGHKIKNLFIHRPNSDKVGLFCAFEGTMISLNFEGGTITGNDYVGAVAGELGGGGNIIGVNSNISVTGRSFIGGLAGQITSSNTSISRSSCTGLVTGSNDYVGGIIGMQYYGTLKNVFFNGTVSGAFEVGGLAGVISCFDNNQCDINNSYTAGSIAGAAHSRGGFAGYTEGSEITSINSSFSTANVPAASQAGGLLGQVSGSTQITDSYFDATSTSQIGCVNGNSYPGCTGNRMRHIFTTLPIRP